jgi:PD-(D/E)XK nuclease superfamily protein
MDFSKFNQLLDEFSRIPRLPQAEQTFMEIAGYPHYENVVRNILAFFLNPENAHGLKAVVLESLLGASGKTASDADLDDVKVSCEEGTGSGRLDLLVEAASLVVGVEIKIFAEVHNDLQDYARFVTNKAGGGKEPVLLLLTLRSPNGALNLAGFRPVTYVEFINQILIRIGPLMPAANTCYVSYLMDLIRTFRNLSRRPEMDPSAREFLERNADGLAALQGWLDGCEGEMGRSLTGLINLVHVNRHPDLYDVVGPCSYGREWTGRLALCQYYDVKVPGQSNLAGDVYITPRGWRIVAFRRDGADITNLLEAGGIASTLDEWYANRRLCFTFEHGADPGEIATKLQSVIDVLQHRPD